MERSVPPGSRASELRCGCYPTNAATATSPGAPCSKITFAAKARPGLARKPATYVYVSTAVPPVGASLSCNSFVPEYLGTMIRNVPINDGPAAPLEPPPLEQPVTTAAITATGTIDDLIRRSPWLGW